MQTDDPRSGVGGYQLLVESLLPIVHDPNSREGREALNLCDPRRVGDDRAVPAASGRRCELFESVRAEKSADPGAAGSFLAAGRFAFQDSLASTDAERANPWLLLNRAEPDGRRVPVIADANSMTYVLHRRLGEDIVVDARATRRSGCGSWRRCATASFSGSC